VGWGCCRRFLVLRRSFGAFEPGTSVRLFKPPEGYRTPDRIARWFDTLDELDVASQRIPMCLEPL